MAKGKGSKKGWKKGPKGKWRKLKKGDKRVDTEDGNETFLHDGSLERLDPDMSDEQIMEQPNRDVDRDGRLSNLFPEDDEKQDPFDRVDEETSLLNKEGSPDFKPKKGGKGGKGGKGSKKPRKKEN